MKSSLPKVLHLLKGYTLVERVLDSCRSLDPTRQLVIVGYQAPMVEAALSHKSGLEFVEQRQQLGTGHAIQQLIPHLQGYQGELLVLNGDAPLLRAETLEKLLHMHQTHQNSASLLTANLPNPKGYGRVFCNSHNSISQIIEDRDCSDAQRQNRRVNAGIYCFDWQQLSLALPRLKADNDQAEYYLTDVVKHLEKVMAVDVDDYLEITGINDRKQLSTAHTILQQRTKDFWMSEGVTLIDPDSITIDDTVTLSPDAIIEPQTHLRGNTEIGAGCRIGPGSLIENSRVAENATVLYSVVSDSQIGAGSRIGPYSHLRGEVKVAASCRVGNFVELKKSQLGEKTNVAHLSYLGDATLGEQVNVGAGTITANYDGFEKHPTTIGDRTKTGANSVFVAPVTVGNDVTIAAGSVITQKVPDKALGIARQRQRIIENWFGNPG